MKRWKWITLGVIIVAQFVQPNRTTPPARPELGLEAMTKPSAEVAATLRTTCYDCHSNETSYPWYAYVTPVNWWIQKSHVEHGRHHVSFSAWGSYSSEDRSEVAEEAVEMLEKHAMPLPSYTWMHPEARMTEEERAALVTFFNALR